MADANIFQQYLNPVRSVADYASDMDKRDLMQVQVEGAKRQNALANIAVQTQMAQNQQALDKQNALQRIYSDPTAADPLVRERLLMSNPLTADVGQQVQTARLNAGKIGADTSKAQAEADSVGWKTKVDKANKAISDITALATPQDAMASLQSHLKAGDIDQAKYDSVMGTLQPALQDPSQFGKWQRNMVLGIMDAKDRIAATAPKVEMVNTGGTLVPTNVNADAGAIGQAPGTAPIKLTASPDTIANNQTSRANNRDNIAKDYAVAGLSPDGTVNTGNQKALVDMLGQFKLDPGQALARVPLAQRASLIAQVQAAYPGWDETIYGAKKAAMAKFTVGEQGNALRSVSVANNHLDQLGELADAMQNGNVQVVNKAVNFFKTQTGDPSVNSFDAIKNIVGQEVVKAIVAGGGSSGERDEAAKSFSNAASPAQLKDVIKHYRMVMGAQKSALIDQGKYAGVPESMMPNYGAKPAATAPAADMGGFTITHIDGKAVK